MKLLKFLFIFFVFKIYPQQNIETALAFFLKVSDNYKNINSYSANLSITIENNENDKKDIKKMNGILFYKKPNLVRINFSLPRGQILTSNGEHLKIYVPQYAVTFIEKMDNTQLETNLNIATIDGLSMMRKNYSIAFLKGPDMEALYEGSNEMVKKMILTWKNPIEGFRKLELSINQRNLIRRIVGITADYKSVRFDFNDINTNKNISTSFFNYEPPADTNIFNNFLFNE